LRPGVTVPIPCRACGGMEILHSSLAEGTHSLSCSKCGVETQIEVYREGDELRLKTRTPSETGLPPAAEEPSSHPDNAIHSSLTLTLRKKEPKKMAKQKLTPEKKAALRKELKAKLSAKVSPSEILKSLSAKFGISPEGVRWYMNAESPNGSSKKVKAPKKAKAAKAKSRKPRPAKKTAKRAKAKRAYSRKPSSNGRALHLPKFLGTLTEKALKGLLAAKKLVPHLESVRQKEEELRQGVRNLMSKLRAMSSKARRLQRRIKKLVRV
jgi:hypothetical protein